jgi:hypothetical protein
MSTDDIRHSQFDDGHSLLSEDDIWNSDLDKVASRSASSSLTGPLLASFNADDTGFVIGDEEDDDDDASTVHGDDIDIYTRPKRLLPGDIRLIYPEYPIAEVKSSRPYLSSPVSNVRMSAFFGEVSDDERDMTMPNETTDRADYTSMPPSANTTSFSSAARSTFGIGMRKRASLQSVTSPARAEIALCSPSALNNISEKGHTVVNLLPMSPITPRRSVLIHTPHHLHFDDELKVNTRLVLPLRKHDSEPLSATLRKLGALRGILCSEDEAESIDYNESDLASHEWETKLVERLDNHHMKKIELLEANQLALQESKGLFPLKFFDKDERGIGDEQSSQLDLKSLLNADKDRQSQRGAKPANGHIQSTTRGGRQNPSVRSTLGQLSTILTGYIYGNLHDTKRSTDEVNTPMSMIHAAAFPSRPGATVSRATGDGWGGLRPHFSWFPDVRLGPLVSPRQPSSNHLRPFRLQATAKNPEEDEWIDEEEIHLIGRTEVAEEEEPPMTKMRVKFPSYLPKPSRDSRSSSCSSVDSGRDDNTLVVSYTKRSAEGRPASRRDGLSVRHFLRSNFGLFLALLLILSMAVVMAVIATSALDHTKLDP